MFSLLSLMIYFSIISLGINLPQHCIGIFRAKLFTRGNEKRAFLIDLLREGLSEETNKRLITDKSPKGKARRAAKAKSLSYGYILSINPKK